MIVRSQYILTINVKRKIKQNDHNQNGNGDNLVSYQDQESTSPISMGSDLQKEHNYPE